MKTATKRENLFATQLERRIQADAQVTARISTINVKDNRVTVRLTKGIECEFTFTEKTLIAIRGDARRAYSYADHGNRKFEICLGIIRGDIKPR